MTFDMPNLRLAEANYFLPPQDWFWQWQERGRVAVWHNGPTIAFRDEVETILKHLAPHGWPPLGSVLLLLAACRDSWHETPGRGIGLTNLFTTLRGTPHDFEAVRKLMVGLDRVHALPADLRHSLPACAELAAIIFEPVRERVPPAECHTLLESWNQWRSDELQSGWRHPSLDEFRREIYALGDLDFIENVLRIRMQTGLDELPLPAPVEVEPSPTARLLLDQLADDPEFCGLANLAKHLLAVVSLPRPVADPTELPEGGVSDISNRGPLDRLLLSELAHDEMTLAVRIALNEALYYRRETPPSPPPRARKLLIDSGVRMWGVPRVFAAAVGLALAATPEKKLETTTFRTNGRFLDPVDFTTRDGLAAHLGELQTKAHPGEALPEFLAEIEDDPCAAEGVLITCDDAFADSEFKRLLAQCPFETLYVVTVSREGRYALLARSRRGLKLLREATLDLDRILAARPKRPPLVDTSHVSPPAIFGVEPFPLLLSVPLETERSWHVEGIGVFSYTRDGRLLHWLHPGQGARQLEEQLPQGRLFACQHTASHGRTLSVVGKAGPNGLHAVQIDYLTQRVTWTRLQFPHVPQLPVAIHNDKVLLRHGGNIVTLDATSGEVVSQTTSFGLGGQIGRIAAQTDGQSWFAVPIDTNQMGPQHSARRSPINPPLAAFECHGIEGIVVVNRAGQVEIDAPQGTSGTRTIEVKHNLHPPLQVAAVSRDGQRFLLAGNASPSGGTSRPRNQCLVTLPSGAVRAVYGDAALALEPHLGQYVRPRVLRSKFSGIGVNDAGLLTLVGRKRRAWPIEFDSHANVLRLAIHPYGLPTRIVSFDSLDSSHGYALHVARFASGDVAWLDGRGLLHLRAADSRLPEVTIVLSENVLGGWLSDGRVWGPAYFHGQTPLITATEVYDQALEPMIKGLQ
jgi:hypothetical protein